MHSRDFHGADLAGPASRSCFTSRLARLLTVGLLAMLLIAGFGVVAPQGATAGQGGTINRNNVELFQHLRDQTVIGYLQSGARVDIFWGPENHQYEVRTSSGTVGWVWAEFVDVDGATSSSGGSTSASSSTTSSSSSSTESPAKSNADRAAAWSWSAWAMVDADSLNVRADASTSARVLDSYRAGAWIEIIGNDVNGFSPTNYGGSVAWVATKHLSWDGTYRYASTGTPSKGSGGGSSTSSSSGSSSSAERWIRINGGTGEVNLMVGTSIHATYWGSVGFDTSPDGFYSTANGTFYVYAMYEPLGYTKWADAYITHWVGYDKYRSNGFHSYMKDSRGNVLPNGAGKTGGCVALSAGAIQAVYDWSYIGMRIVVYR